MVLTPQRITRALTTDEEGRESMKANRGLKAAMLAMAMVVLATTAASAAPTDEQKCQSGRAKEAGKYRKCVQNWLAKGYKGGPFDQVKLAKCRIKYAGAWTKLQTLTGTTCDAARYVDNGDGTITDNLTGLVWEKKSDNGDVHDVNNTYSWSTGSPWNGDGTAFTSFLAVGATSLNEAGFAGANDWRLPTFAELQTILLPEPYPCTTNPCVDSAFDSGCTGGCSVTTCSCTNSSSYSWSSTTYQYDPTYAWIVTFYDGWVGYGHKAFTRHVRAVRGGS